MPTPEAGAVGGDKQFMTRWMDWYRTQYQQLNQRGAMLDDRSKQLDAREQALYTREKKMWEWVDDLTTRERSLGQRMQQQQQQRRPPRDGPDRRDRPYERRDRPYDSRYSQQSQQQQYPYQQSYPQQTQQQAWTAGYYQQGSTQYPSAYQQQQASYQAQAPAPINTSGQSSTDKEYKPDSPKEYSPDSPAYCPTSPQSRRKD